MSWIRIRIGPWLLLLALLALPAAPGRAEPAALGDRNAPRERALRSFRSFAEAWVGRMRSEEARTRARPASAGPARVRSVEGNFAVELRPTGSPVAPWVGLLRYSEVLYECAGGGAACRVASRTPITEVFRFQAGRWIY